MAGRTAKEGAHSEDPGARHQPGTRRRERLSAADRLHNPSEFERVYETRQAVRTPKLVVFWSANGLPGARLGVSVGKKHGNAVRRNRIKRVFRAAFRQCRHLLPAGRDYVLVPRVGVQDYSAAVVCEALQTVARRL